MLPWPARVARILLEVFGAVVVVAAVGRIVVYPILVGLGWLTP